MKVRCKKWFFIIMLFLSPVFGSFEDVCVGGQSLEELLFCAIERLDTGEVQRLIAAGAHSNAYLRNKTPLYVAFQKVTQGYDMLDIIRYLLEAGASFKVNIVTADQEICTVGEYAEEALDNYLESLELYDPSMSCIRASDEEISICIRRARKLLKLVRQYL